MKDLIETLEEYANGFTNVIAPPEEDVKELLEHIYNQDKEINRLNNIINEVKQKLLNKKDIVEKSKYFKLVYYTDWNMKHEWDKRIVDKIDEIINIIDEENK